MWTGPRKVVGFRTDMTKRTEFGLAIVAALIVAGIVAGIMLPRDSRNAELMETRQELDTAEMALDNAEDELASLEAQLAEANDDLSEAKAALAEAPTSPRPILRNSVNGPTEMARFPLRLARLNIGALN